MKVVIEDFMSVSVVSFSSSVANPLLKSALAGLLVLKDARALEVRDVTDIKELKILQKTLKIWEETAEDRLAESQAYYAKINTEEAEKKQEDDEIAVVGFKVVTDLIRSSIQDRIDNTSQIDIVKVAIDEDNNIQGMCSAIFDSDEIYVCELVTAPWNLKMHGKVGEVYESRVMKGVGTALLSSLYREGLNRSIASLRLHALSGAITYYRDYLQMERDSENPEDFTYSISEIGEFPKGLQKALKSISHFPMIVVNEAIPKEDEQSKI